jgi:NAD(P)H dehydrogenase (quinone)
VILVTGAAGKTGRAIIRALAARGAEVRAFVHREAHRATVMQEGARSVGVGSLDDIDALTRAAGGAAAIYHLAPNVSPHEVAYGAAAIAAAKAAGVPRFVFHSVLHPQIEAMPHHWRKMRVEEALFASTLAATILQPAAYMQNLLASRRSIVDDGILRVPYRD